MANEVRASHILVDKKTDADKLMEKLKSGSNFEDLARSVEEGEQTHGTAALLQGSSEFECDQATRRVTGEVDNA
ncbi:MAG: hypothetical protein R6W91_02675 [Thermoplasmata archaeon]